MPVKIKHKQLGAISDISYSQYEQSYINNDLYELISITNVYELYNRKSGIELWQATLEKETAINSLEKYPNWYRIEY